MSSQVTNKKIVDAGWCPLCHGKRSLREPDGCRNYDDGSSREGKTVGDLSGNMKCEFFRRALKKTNIDFNTELVKQGATQVQTLNGKRIAPIDAIIQGTFNR